VRRREFITLLGAVLIRPQCAWAQPGERSYRLGWLSVSSIDNFKEPYSLDFVRHLVELGFVEGRNLIIERRHADNRLERLPGLAAELATVPCDIFFGGGAEAALAALTRSSRDTPIVFVAVDFDPISTGDVASLAQPGGRVTGVTTLQSTLPAKRLELLKELLPAVSKVAVFANEETAGQLALVRGTARRLEISLHVVEFKRAPFDFEAGFVEAARLKADALFVLGSGLWVSARQKIPELALKAKLPSVFHQAQWAEAGGLMSYGFNFPWMWRRAAGMVANILHGARPADIPMEQPTTFELAINLKTAKSLGITIPQSFMLRADKVIE